MKKAIFLFLFLQVYLSPAQTENLNKWRKNYSQAPKDSSTCAKMYRLINKEDSKDNILMCYRGAISTMMAEHAAGKAEKLKLFNAGKNLIEQSISKDSNNVELRFIRFTVQTSCPKALGYNRQISSDKGYILTNFGTVSNTELKQLMSYFLDHSTYLTGAERSKITH